jgi:hypothetical protein
MQQQSLAQLLRSQALLDEVDDIERLSDTPSRVTSIIENQI